jgi:hypothetical protein
MMPASRRSHYQALRNTSKSIIGTTTLSAEYPLPLVLQRNSTNILESAEIYGFFPGDYCKQQVIDFLINGKPIAFELHWSQLL